MLILNDIKPETLIRRGDEKWSSHPENIIPVDSSDIDYPVCDSIKEALLSTVSLSGLGYPLETDELATLLSKRMAKRYGIVYETENIVFTSDVMQAIYICIETNTAPGDSVIVFSPQYPPLKQAIEELGRKTIEVPLLTIDGKYIVDVNSLKRHAPMCRALLICHPHNPTGHVMTSTEMNAVAEIAIEHDLLILSDEVHQEFIWSDYGYIPMACSFSAIEDRVISVTSTSKSFGLAGLGCAAVMSRNSGLINRFRLYPRRLRGRISRLALLAAQCAWSGRSDIWLSCIKRQLMENRRLLLDFVGGNSDIDMIPPQGTYFAWINLSKLEFNNEAYLWLKDNAHVAARRGADFGVLGSDYIRINFATSPRILMDVLSQFQLALNTYRLR